jgi:hypothetical protein
MTTGPGSEACWPNQGEGEPRRLEALYIAYRQVLAVVGKTFAKGFGGRESREARRWKRS